MNLLVIGNGFDLAHGLPTKYSDFLGFVKYFALLHNSSTSDVERYKQAEKTLKN
ncbi:AbiH family protein [Clostridium saccharobutylicum]|uniref:Bacteriophage abortive infection AbiH n=1 Tax=Clostridium saccharobutylicum TaxID=169679 RepID=A0A1S8MYM6_CLOSA|nr:AbiH family protein [Clostridium saccharobutylicum]OOM09319.1 hypothetical protein CLOSAC_36000 [Clostridium saccharobutylicum]